MKRVQNITNEPIQRHTIFLPGGNLILKLRFLPPVQIWVFDAEYNGWTVKGIKLSLGVLHIVSQNQPFDFVVIDRSRTDIDPFRRNDFSTGRCELVLLEPSDMVDVRGDAVPPTINTTA